MRYHLEVEWPDAAIDEHQPGLSAALPPSRDLAALDLRLLGHPVAGDDGFELLKGPGPQPYGDLSD